MKLDEICSGCSRHVAVCVCGVSIGPEGAVHYRPNPTNLAGKLKIVANNAKLEMIKIKTQRLVDQILWRATQAATRGDYSINIWLSDLGITKETAELVAKELERDGFKCAISNEITAQYSNTDWDSEDLLFVSWE